MDWSTSLGRSVDHPYVPLLFFFQFSILLLSISLSYFYFNLLLFLSHTFAEYMMEEVPSGSSLTVHLRMVIK